MESTPTTLTLLHRTIGALADVAAAGAGRRLVVGDGRARITAELRDLEIEPAEVLNVLDPTAIDARLAGTIRLPMSMSDLAAPWRAGARAALQATGSVTQAMLAAGGGRYELASGLGLVLAEVEGPTWSASRMSMTGGPVVFAARREPVVRWTGIEITADLTTADLERRLADLPIEAIRVGDDGIEIRPEGRLRALTLRVRPRVLGDRIALEAHEVVWRRRSVRLPAPLARRLVRWVAPPAWLEVGRVEVRSGRVSIAGSCPAWEQPLSIETVQRLARAARRRGQDLVLPGSTRPTGDDGGTRRSAPTDRSGR